MFEILICSLTPRAGCDHSGSWKWSGLSQTLNGYCLCQHVPTNTWHTDSLEHFVLNCLGSRLDQRITIFMTLDPWTLCLVLCIFWIVIQLYLAFQSLIHAAWPWALPLGCSWVSACVRADPSFSCLSQKTLRAPAVVFPWAHVVIILFFSRNEYWVLCN